jgi:hypothetical protein
MVEKLKKEELVGGERKWLFRYLRGEDDGIDWEDIARAAASTSQ